MPSMLMIHCLHSLYDTPTCSASCCMMQIMVYTKATVFILSMISLEYDACLVGYHLISCLTHASHTGPLAEMLDIGQLHT